MFAIKLYMFRTVPLPIIRKCSLYTQPLYMSYRFADSLRAGSGRSSVLILLASCQQTCMYCCVQWRTPDDGQRNCPKHVEFYSKSKFQKSVHLFGFIIIIYHDAWPHERQIQKLELSRQISKNTQTLNFMKIRPEGAELPMQTDGRTDGQTDTTKLIARVRNFTKAQKKKLYPVQDSNTKSPNRKTFTISITLNQKFDRFN